MRALDECVIGWAVGLVFSTGAGVDSCCSFPGGTVGSSLFCTKRWQLRPGSSAARHAVPFPGMGQQTRFRNEMARIIPLLPKIG